MTIDLALVRTALRRRTHVAAEVTGTERFAAVAAVLRERGAGAEVLLIRRAKSASDPWSGHMAFPGGRKDPTDPDVLSTAIRETEEELGLRLNAETDLVGRLDDLPAVARGKPVGMIIAPFVFAIAGEPRLSPNAREVDEAVWAELSPLARGSRDTTYAYTFDGEQYSLPAYDVEGRVVWGLTHRMLCLLFEALDGVPRADYWRRS